MEVVFKRSATEKVKDIIYGIYDVQGVSGIQKIEYIAVSQAEMDELSNGSGFTRAKEFLKSYFIPVGYAWIAIDVKCKVAE